MVDIITIKLQKYDLTNKKRVEVCNFYPFLLKSFNYSVTATSTAVDSHTPCFVQ